MFGNVVYIQNANAPAKLIIFCRTYLMIKNSICKEGF